MSKIRTRNLRAKSRHQQCWSLRRLFKQLRMLEKERVDRLAVFRRAFPGVAGADVVDIGRAEDGSYILWSDASRCLMDIDLNHWDGLHVTEVLASTSQGLEAPPRHSTDS